MNNHTVEIISNIKSPDGNSYRVPFGKNTILIGENEAGKSAIAESLQLARTGSAFGLLYRDKLVRDGKLLSNLIPVGEDRARAVAAFENGETCSWTLERGKRAQKKGQRGSVLSVAELHTIMAGTNESKIKFFWERLCEPVSVTDLMAGVPEDLHETLVLVCPLEGKINLTELLDKIGKFQRNQNDVVKAGQIALESMGSIREITEDEMHGVWDTIQRAMVRDVTKAMYRDHKADPTLQLGPAIQYLIEYLGGKEAFKKISITDEAASDLSEVLMHKRLSRAALAARNGESKASSLRDSLKALKVAVLNLMKASITAVAEEFCERIGAFLPEDEEFLFEIDGGDLDIGLWKVYPEESTRDGHIALSGSTEARILAAIASGLAEENDLIVVDDRMWDSDTLRKTMIALEKSPAQVVIMSTISPKGRARKAWKYVKISREAGKPLEVSDEGRKD